MKPRMLEPGGAAAGAGSEAVALQRDRDRPTPGGHWELTSRTTDSHARRENDESAGCALLVARRFK